MQLQLNRLLILTEIICMHVTLKNILVVIFIIMHRKTRIIKIIYVFYFRLKLLIIIYVKSQFLLTMRVNISIMESIERE